MVASGPAESWQCLGVGVTLFEQEDPFWWRRAHPQDEEERAKELAQHKEKARRRRLGGIDGGDGEYDGTRRKGIVRNRANTGARDENGEERGGYTDLEVLEVLDPAHAARVRLRQARCDNNK